MIIAEVFLCLIDQIGIDFVAERCSGVERLESFQNILVGIHEVENVSVFLARIDAVDPTQRLDGFDATKSLILSLIHISEPTRLGMISYAVFCLKKKKKN